MEAEKRFILGETLSNRLELDFVNLYAWILHMVKDKDVLDIACGSGLGSYMLAYKARSVLGVDISESAIRSAQELYRLSNLQFETADVFDVKLAPKTYDIIVTAMTIEQLAPERHQEYLQKLRHALKVDGVIILVTPNKTITSPYTKSGGHRWNHQEYTQKQLQELISVSELSVISWHGRRNVFMPMSLYLLRRALGLAQRITRKNFGFYGSRERPDIQPHTYWRRAKDFVVLLKRA